MTPLEVISLGDISISLGRGHSSYKRCGDSDSAVSRSGSSMPLNASRPTAGGSDEVGSNSFFDLALEKPVGQRARVHHLGRIKPERGCGYTPELMSDLLRILAFAPFTAAAIAAEKRLARWWPLPFPRSIDEIESDPSRLFALLTTPSRGAIAPLSVPPGAVFAGVARRGGPEQEPDKYRTTGVLDLLFHGERQSVIRVVIKLQSGRGMPLYMQAIRAVIEQAFSREIEFYRRLAPVVPVRVARPLFAEAVTLVNRVCLVVEYVESTTPADWRGCSLPAMRALLDNAALLNACFLGRLNEPSAAWIPARSGLEYAKFVDRFIGKAEPWYREVWNALRRYFAPRPVTLVHGDCRPGNMLVTGDSQVHAVAGSETDAAPWPAASAPVPGVVMSDWEAVNIAPLMWDFTYATIIGLRIGDRDAWLDRLLDEFLASLEAAGVPPAELDRPTCRLQVDSARPRARLHFAGGVRAQALERAGQYGGRHPRLGRAGASCRAGG